jgi:hypothetical protein
VIRKFFASVLPGIIRPLRVLWNEVIGFMFVALGVLFASSAIRSALRYDGDSTEFFRLVLTCVFSVVMLGFGISSFLRARKISRS